MVSQYTAALALLLLVSPAWSQQNATDSVMKLQQQVLETKISIDVESIPLSKLLDLLEEKSGFSIRIHERSLGDTGVPLDTAVSGTFRDTSLHSVLKWSLADLDIGYYLEPDGIVICASHELESHFCSRFYPAGQLTGKPLPDFDSLIDMTTECLDADSWEMFGGEGVIAPIHDGVMIRQSTARHRLVNSLYKELTKVAEMSADDYRHDSVLVTLLPEQTASLRVKMHSEQLDWGASEMPLRKALDELRSHANVNMYLDEPELFDLGLGLDVAVSLRPRKRSLARTLDLLLEPIELGWYVADDVVVITSINETYEAPEVRIYPVRDLVWRGLDAQAPDLKERLARYLPKIRRHPMLYWDNPFPILLPSPILQSIPADDDLTEMLTSTIEPDSWVQLGGPGVIAFLPQTDCFVVTQTAKVHAQIAEELAQLRRHNQPLSKEEFFQSVEREGAEIITAWYPVAYTFRETQEQREQDLRRVFQQIQYRVEPGSWSRGDVYLTHADGRIRIRHTRAAQRQILALLIEAGVVRPIATGHFCNGVSTASFEHLEGNAPPEPTSPSVPPIPKADPVENPTPSDSSEDPFG